MSDDIIPVAAMVTYCCEQLRGRLGSGGSSTGLVVGCGTGDEVFYICRALGARVFGVDLEDRFSERARKSVVLSNALRLPFGSEAFDFAVALHSLEHVGDAAKAVDEVHRVLRPGGWFYAGVPNRTRVAGYLGSFDASAWQKIAWNAEDWLARLRGRFRNEAGAHAGFDREEFSRLLGARFSDVEILTGEYLRFKYARRIPSGILNQLLSPRWLPYSVPAHYALCRKTTGNNTSC
ncbi:MAG: methyltransferase domain-containing protein [Terriglobia bacterium]